MFFLTLTSITVAKNYNTKNINIKEHYKQTQLCYHSQNTDEDPTKCCPMPRKWHHNHTPYPNNHRDPEKHHCAGGKGAMTNFRYSIYLIQNALEML